MLQAINNQPFPVGDQSNSPPKNGPKRAAQACIDEMQRIVDNTRRRQNAATASTQPPAAAQSPSPSPSAEVYDEMLQDCRRKAGEATLDRLRKLCQRLSRPNVDGDDGSGTGGMGDEGEGLMMREEETVIVSYHAALLGKAEGAANIYGG